MEKNIEIRSFAEAPTHNEDGRTIEGYAIVFGVLIVVLLVKPTGILGKNIQEKV